MSLTFKKQEAGCYLAATPEGWDVQVAKYQIPSSESAVYGRNGQSLSHYWSWTIWGQTAYHQESNGGAYQRTMSECKEAAAEAYVRAQEQTNQGETEMSNEDIDHDAENDNECDDCAAEGAANSDLGHGGDFDPPTYCTHR